MTIEKYWDKCYNTGKEKVLFLMWFFTYSTNVRVYMFVIVFNIHL